MGAQTTPMDHGQRAATTTADRCAGSGPGGAQVDGTEHGGWCASATPLISRCFSILLKSKEGNGWTQNGLGQQP